MFQKPFVVLDLETSGIDPKNNQIIEVALIRYEKGKETARFESLVKIDFELPRIITAITGITDKELQKKGRPKEEVFAEIEDLLRDAYLVGHNIKFDVGFLKAKGFKLKVEGLIDTVPLAQIVMPEAVSYSLESLAEDLGLTHRAHRAMADVEATLDLFRYLIDRIETLPPQSIEEIQGALLKSEWEGGVVFAEAKGGRVSKAVAGETLFFASAQDRLSKSDSARPSKALTMDEIFGKNGVMQRSLEGYESRPQQFEMAKQVMNAFEQGYHLICEAPTGVGKSLAYLAAAAAVALKNKSKVVISTNTLNLQEQLYEKDLPLLQKFYQEVMGQVGLKTALLKGRSHYLCLRRLAEFKRRPRFTVTEVILLIKILVWQLTTQTGDSAEIHITREEQLVWDFELCSDKKYCSPAKCQPFGQCYLHQAREMAEEADIIIANHALLCADLQNGGGLLPEYHYLVIDEAHHFEEAATRAFATEVSQESVTLPSKLIQNHLRDWQHQHPELLRQMVEKVLGALPDLHQFIDNFFSVVAFFVGRNVPDSGYTESLLVDRVVLGMPEWLNLESSMQEAGQRLNEWTTRLKELVDQFLMLDKASVNGLESFTDELLQEIEVLQEQIQGLKTFFNEEEAASRHQIRWMTSDLTGVVSLHLAPLLVGPLLKESLYDQKKSIILTSATLSVNTGEDAKPFAYLRQMLGLDERFEEVILDSPFNFEAQSYVLLPNDALPLTAKSSMEQVSDFFAKLIGLVGGGLLGLFTSYSAIETLYLALMDRPEVQKTKILAQRVSGGRNKIMKAYMNDPLHSVLLGTASFWEGVDLEGDALTTLIIHKLPFDVPSEPIFKARQELFANPFMAYSVPRAVLRFKQGFGRLIRSKKDYGTLVVLDNRVTTKDFGQSFLKTLPKGIPIDRIKLEAIPKKAKEWLDLSQEKS